MKLGTIAAELEASTRARQFSEFCAALMLGKGIPENALRHAADYEFSRPVQAVLKTAVAGGTTQSADALASFAPLAQGFSATLANVSAFDGILADAVQVPLHSVFGVVVSDCSAASVGEGSAKPVTFASTSNARLQEKKAAAMCVVSADLLRFGAGALTLLENSLRTGVAAATNAIFVGAMVGLTTPVSSSGDVFRDLRTLTDAAGSGSNSKFHLVVGPAVARHLALTATTTGAPVFPQMTVTGGTLPGGITVHVSDALDDDALLIDASALAANADAISVSISHAGAVEMDGAPSASISEGSPSAPTSAATNMVSLFQTNSVAILVQRIFGFELLRATAAQSLSGITWSLVGSPPA